MKRLTRRITQAADSDDTSGVWLKPYMKARPLKANDILFRKGDTADLCIDESTVKQLYFRNPKFGFEMVGLVAGRLSADVGRLQDQ